MYENEQHIDTLTSGALHASELQIQEFVQWIKLGVETIGALLVAVGVVIAVVQLVRVIGRPTSTYTGVRLTFARYLALALEFQLGADILSTSVAPSWDQIGKLGAIAIIRTALNFFISREMRQEGDEREMEIKEMAARKEKRE